MNTTKTKSKNLATPGKPISEEEFTALIRQAEKDHFKSIKNLKKDVIATWKKKYSK